MLIEQDLNAFLGSVVSVVLNLWVRVDVLWAIVVWLLDLMVIVNASAVCLGVIEHRRALVIPTRTGLTSLFGDV